MGKCLTIVKLVGIGSLGLSSSLFLYSSQIQVPELLKSSGSPTAEFKNKLTSIITIIRGQFWSLGSIASYLLYQAYTNSPSYGKHPYLIYAALSFPIALAYNYYSTFTNEQKILNNTEEETTYTTETRVVKETVPQPEETSNLDNSNYNILGESPKVVEKEVQVEVPTVKKIALTEATLNSILPSILESYYNSGAILGAGFLLGLIGYIGDNLK